MADLRVAARAADVLDLLEPLLAPIDRGNRPS
jgi:hypothetical protein